jgi:hypothetical protein
MRRLLFKVEDVFVIQGRGVLLAPGYPSLPEEAFKVGDALELRRPDHTILKSTIAGVSILPSPDPATSIQMAFFLPPQVAKDDIPIGTEVWLT